MQISPNTRDAYIFSYAQAEKAMSIITGLRGCGQFREQNRLFEQAEQNIREIMEYLEELIDEE